MGSTAVHHHRSTTKSHHKPFKSRYATKGSLRTKAKGKTDEDTFTRKTPHQQVLSKLERRHRARQIAENKHRDVLRAGKIFDGRRGAARIIAVVPLCSDGDSADAVRKLNTSLDISVDVPNSGILNLGIERFKQKVQYVFPPRQDFLAVLDACKLADFVVLLLSAKEPVDAYGDGLLRAIEGQGISSVVTAVQYLDTVEPAKRRPDVKKSLLSYITHFFPTEAKVHSLDAHQDAQNVIRSLCAQNPKGIRWRDARSYLLAEQVRWDERDGLVVAGTVRGKGMKADRLVHIPGYGDYQVEKICAWKEDETPAPSSDAMAIDIDVPAANGAEVIELPTAGQDDLDELAPEEDVMQDVGMDDNESVVTTQPHGVLIDDHHYFEEKEDERYTAPRRLPKGTSAYQASWILDSDFSESELEDVDEDGDGDVGMHGEGEDEDDIDEDAARPEDGAEGMAGESKSTYAPTEFGDAKSEMFLDPSPEQEAEQIKAFRDRRKDAAEDLEFPDEIELPPNALARERLGRYRGLKSLRSSKWETAPDRPHQPANWDRLAQIQNYSATKAKILSEALVGGVPAGTRVLLYIRSGPKEAADQSKGGIMAVYSLLRHEHKKSVVHYSIMPTITGNIDTEEQDPNSLASHPVKSKDPLILQVGPRRLLINPLFSSPSVSPTNSISKFERFLHPARTSVATIIGPLTFGTVPVLFFRPPPPTTTTTTPLPPHLLATGTTLPPTPRLLIKRIVLTGHPYKIHKKLVTIRYMFFNIQDVNWFKPVQLFTKRGRCGYIKESLGTHGWFKATFDGKVDAMDAIGMSLYKRVWPREARGWRA